MDDSIAALPDHTGTAPILHTLETQLIELDRIGSQKAAAHLDAAIQQLRRDLETERISTLAPAQGNTAA
ncbi:MAG: hypothetical protein WBA51_04820 [Erythrobacter sp.]